MGFILFIAATGAYGYLNIARIYYSVSYPFISDVGLWSAMHNLSPFKIGIMRNTVPLTDNHIGIVNSADRESVNGKLDFSAPLVQEYVAKKYI